ncbi:hypothetical protein Droror1_Dr00008124 [Drosera rotundifolia]
MVTIKVSLLENHWHQILSLRRKNVSGFGLGVCALLSVLTLIFFTHSSSKTWRFSIPSSGISSASSSENHSGNVGEEEGNIAGETHVANATVSCGVLGFSVNGTGSGKTHVGIGNVSLNQKLDHLGQEQNANNADDSGANRRRGNGTLHRRVGVLGVEEGKIGQVLVSNHGSDECDYFDGRWVRDDTRPYYPPGSCHYVDKSFNCHLNGRPDDGYLKWRWQPYGCDIPRLDAHKVLERLRDKKLVFVGDSLNRNMWESLVCILQHNVRNKKRVYEISGRSDFKKKGIYAIRFEDYNCSVDFVVSPFLVRESLFQGKNGTIETLRLDVMDLTTATYHDADVIVFNTGHWWTHEKTSKGEDYYREGNYVYPRLKALNAYGKALATWAMWVDQHIDPKRTLVFFRGYSPTHFRGGQWNSGGQCHRETEPIFNETYLGRYPSKMRSLEHVLKQMNTPVIYLNVSRLTDYRKDGHPSIYRMKYETDEQRQTAEQSQDCSHWCVPGVPDTWNELLYAYILKHQKRT